MKLTTFFLLISLANLASTGYSQSEKVTVQMQDAKLKDLFKTIEQQTDYKFLYRDDVIDNIQVNINETDIPLDDVLTQVLSESDFSFKVMPNNLIVIAPLRILQQLTITGTIYDENKNPLPGVNILIEGTTTGTISDPNGKYSINTSNSSDVLVFSFIGYESNKIPVSGKSIIDVSLTPILSSLNEVVVIGYGTMKKMDIAGATSSVSAKQLKKMPVTTLGQSLQGISAGVQVTNMDASPGAGINIKIRGTGTFGDNSPDCFYGYPGRYIKN